jgi:hypothetical protein
MVDSSLPPAVCKRAHVLLIVNHEILLKIKTGYIQTDESWVNTQYKSNKKNKRWELMRLIFMVTPSKSSYLYIDFEIYK